MIGYLEGKLLQKEEDRILVLVNQIGYEVFLPGFIMRELGAKNIGDDISLYIYYHLTERVPKPMLIGFNLEIEKDFFQDFISVEAIGPLKAVKALNISISELAEAIESKDIEKIKQLKGIGKRTAQKIIASLDGKMSRYVTRQVKEEKDNDLYQDIAQKVMDVLIERLGYKASEAKQMIADALERNSSISTPEELFNEVYGSKRH